MIATRTNVTLMRCACAAKRCHCVVCTYLTSLVRFIGFEYMFDCGAEWHSDVGIKYSLD
jgi:hypothetical protein